MTTKEKEWVSTGTLAKTLGVSNQYILKLREKGFFEIRTHYRNIGLSNISLRPTYRWHLKRVLKLLD